MASFFIDKIPIEGNLILAPMDGYSDLPFRSLVRQMGSAISYTEFINAIDVVQHHPRLEKRVAFLESERPVAFQFLDNDIDRLEKAILAVIDRNPDFIDINLGCSSKSVTHRGAGAALLREPGKIAEIFTRLLKSISIPLTAKIRLGWDDKTQNYLEIARIIQDCGGKLVAVHGRTRKQGYTGSANWDAIAEIKQALKIPIIGNGDITSATDIDRMLEHTKCDGVMIGRAAIANPWIFSRRDLKEISSSEVINTFHDLLNRLSDFYDPDLGLKISRKFIAPFTLHYPLSRPERTAFLNPKTRNELEMNLDKLITQYHNTTL